MNLFMATRQISKYEKRKTIYSFALRKEWYLYDYNPCYRFDVNEIETKRI